MKKLLTLLYVVLIATCFVQADNASFGWILTGGGATGSDRSAKVVTDASGNIFTANYFLNIATFNGFTLTGSAKGTATNYDSSLFISKISPDTVTAWNIYSNVGAVTPTSLATTPAGDLIVTGTIRAVVGAATTNANIIDAVGTVTTFTGLSTSSSYVQSFVAKFNTKGVVQWVKELNSGAAKDKMVTTSALAADASGNVYLTGIYTNTVILPSATPVTLTSGNTTQAAFIAKLDGGTGNEIWYKASTGGIVSEVIPALTYGDDGYLYAAGDYKNTAVPVAVTIGDKTFTPSIGADLALIRFDTDGALSYIQQRSCVASTTVRDIRVKNLTVKSGKAFVAGSFYGIDGGIQFSNENLGSTTSYLNGFVAAFTAQDGTDIWHKGILSPAIAEVYGVTIGSDGNLFAFGTYYNGSSTGDVTAGDVAFGNNFVIKDTDPSNKSGDLFLASYNVLTGVTQGVHAVGQGSGSEASTSLASFGNNLYLSGIYNSTPITFENGKKLSTTGSFDFFLVNYKVISPSGVISSDATPSPYSFVDHANHLVVVKNAGSVRFARILDATGRSIKIAFNSNNDVMNINAQGIAAGVYILQLTASNSQITSQRLIIQ